jgi:hypothetical protein
MSVLLSLCYRESLELLLLQPTLITIYLELTNLEEQIIFKVQTFIEQRNKSCTKDNFKTLTEQLSDFCDSVLDFVETVLTIYSYYNNIAY